MELLRSQLRPAQIALVAAGSLCVVSGLALANTPVGEPLIVAGLLCWAGSMLLARTLHAGLLGLFLGALSLAILALIFFGGATLVQNATEANDAPGTVTPHP